MAVRHDKLKENEESNFRLRTLAFVMYKAAFNIETKAFVNIRALGGRERSIML